MKKYIQQLDETDCGVAKKSATYIRRIAVIDIRGTIGIVSSDNNV